MKQFMFNSLSAQTITKTIIRELLIVTTQGNSTHTHTHTKERLRANARSSEFQAIDSAREFCTLRGAPG